MIRAGRRGNSGAEGSAAYLQPPPLPPSAQYLQTLRGRGRAPENARSPSSPPLEQPRKSRLYRRRRTGAGGDEQKQEESQKQVKDKEFKDRRGGAALIFFVI